MVYAYPTLLKPITITTQDAIDNFSSLLML